MTQANLLELAKQGNVEAITSLFNRQLQPKGITAKVVLKLEKDSFASNLEDLELGISSESTNYSYNIISADNSQALTTATAKENGLKSYTGAVLVVKESNESDMKTATCETDSASKTPPANPEFVGGVIKCPSGSSKIDS